MPAATNTKQNPAVQTVRRFHRFYTQKLGLLNEGLLESPFSLTEVRVLFEIFFRDKPTSAEIARELKLDPGYLSRLLSKLENKDLITRTKAIVDTRQSFLSLTIKGREVFASLNSRQDEEVGSFLNSMSTIEQAKLINAMDIIQRLLGSSIPEKVSYLLRGHQPGDLGWIVHRHGVLYEREYGYNELFEAMVANIAADFLQNYDPKYECSWIAERNGELIGSIVLKRSSNEQAILRLLLVEPSARGLGLGKRLVQECIRFAIQTGYKTVILSTHSELLAARHLYEQAGFKLIKEQPYREWGRDNLVEETWELTL